MEGWLQDEMFLMIGWMQWRQVHYCITCSLVRKACDDWRLLERWSGDGL